MKLPNREKAHIPREKILDYLLSPTHRDGKPKHDFFIRFGFTRERWEQLANVLIQHVQSHDVQAFFETPFGYRYIIEGVIMCPDGRQPVILSVWFIDASGNAPRLVTAYPA